MSDLINTNKKNNDMTFVNFALLLLSMSRFALVAFTSGFHEQLKSEYTNHRLLFFIFEMFNQVIPLYDLKNIPENLREIVLKPTSQKALEDKKIALEKFGVALEDMSPELLRFIFSDRCLRYLENKFVPNEEENALSYEQFDFIFSHLYADTKNIPLVEPMLLLLPQQTAPEDWDEEYTPPQTPKEKGISLANIALSHSNFDMHVYVLMQKLQSMQKKPGNNYLAAAKVAQRLYEDLLNARAKFVASENPIPARKIFAQECLEAIKIARPELEKHRGWKQILANIGNTLIFILTLGISYATTNQFNFFSTRTNSAELLDKIERDVHKTQFSPA